MKLLSVTLLFSLIYLTSFSQQQICSFSKERAISINETLFERKGNILGQFYINPNIVEYKIESDSLLISGYITYLYKPRDTVQIYLCKKIKGTIRQRIGRIQIYEIIRYVGETDAQGFFEAKIHKRNEYFLFRDYKLNQDRFLFFKVTDSCD